jgi:AraC-like DNA-binding protein
MFERVSYHSSGKFISSGPWIHPDRVLDSHEIILVTQGVVHICEGNTEYALHPNDLLVLSAGVRHYGTQKSENTSFYWLHWTGADLPIQHRHIDSPHSISLLFNQILHYATDSRFREGLDYLTRLVLMEVCYHENVCDAGRFAEQAAAWIRATAHIPLKSTDVATHFGYNTDYLSRLFRRQFGKTLKQFIDEVRIEYIKSQLLNTNYTLTQLAEMTGFSDYKYFLKFFKYHTGLTPTQFYNTYSKTHINAK